MLPIIRTSISYAGIAARRIRHRHSLPDLPSQISPPLESEISAEQLETTKIPVDPQLEGPLQEAFASGKLASPLVYPGKRESILVPCKILTLLSPVDRIIKWKYYSGSVQKAMTSQKSNLKLNPSVLWTILVKGKRQQSEQAGEEGLSTTIEVQPSLYTIYP